MKLSLPPGIDFQYLLEKLRELCWGSADILTAYAHGEKPPFGYSQSLYINESDDGPVSAADIAVNDWLLRGFERFFPNITWKILSEETSKDVGKNHFVSEKWLWVLDPLDGTKDFLSGSGEYAVHLALVKENIPIIGVVLIPEQNELWFGIVGHGTWCENRLGQKKNFNISERRGIENLVLIASKNHRNSQLEKLLNQIKFKKQNSVGSIGCKICQILKGNSDVYISLSGLTSPKDWDFAAPSALLIHSNGFISHPNGKELIFNSESFEQVGCIVASKDAINHKEVCERIIKEMKNIDSNYIL